MQQNVLISLGLRQDFHSKAFANEQWSLDNKLEKNAIIVICQFSEESLTVDKNKVTRGTWIT